MKEKYKIILIGVLLILMDYLYIEYGINKGHIPTEIFSFTFIILLLLNVFSIFNIINFLLTKNKNENK